MKREDDARLGIEAAIARRKDEFALSHLAWTGSGYTVKFRQGIVQRSCPHVFEWRRDHDRPP